MTDILMCNSTKNGGINGVKSRLTGELIGAPVDWLVQFFGGSNLGESDSASCRVFIHGR